MDSFPIIFENNEILLIHKKAGIPVQGGAGIKHSVDVDLSKQVGQKIFLVHRLDRETEGILCVAKNPSSASKYTKLFSGPSKEIKKEYVALCFGKPVLKGKELFEGTIDFPILKDGKALSATTHFKVEFSVEKKLDGTERSIVISKLRLKIDTGRTHQIRIHLSKVGCPIIGDDKHGDFKLNKVAKKALGIKKLCLAAVKLSLPINDKIKTFSLQKDLFSDIMDL